MEFFQVKRNERKKEKKNSKKGEKKRLELLEWKTWRWNDVLWKQSNVHINSIYINIIFFYAILVEYFRSLSSILQHFITSWTYTSHITDTHAYMTLCCYQSTHTQMVHSSHIFPNRKRNAFAQNCVLIGM